MVGSRSWSGAFLAEGAVQRLRLELGHSSWGLDWGLRKGLDFKFAFALEGSLWLELELKVRVWAWVRHGESMCPHPLLLPHSGACLPALVDEREAERERAGVWCAAPCPPAALP